MILFHATTKESASEILKSGFIDGEGGYGIAGVTLKGVFLSNVPLDVNEGAHGDTLLKIDIDLSERDVSDYEIVEDGKPYREWCIPAELINPRMTVSLTDYESEWRPNPTA